MVSRTCRWSSPIPWWTSMLSMPTTHPRCRTPLWQGRRPCGCACVVPGETGKWRLPDQWDNPIFVLQSETHPRSESWGWATHTRARRCCWSGSTHPSFPTLSTQTSAAPGSRRVGQWDRPRCGFQALGKACRCCWSPSTGPPSSLQPTLRKPRGRDRNGAGAFGRPGPPIQQGSSPCGSPNSPRTLPRWWAEGVEVSLEARAA